MPRLNIILLDPHFNKLSVILWSETWFHISTRSDGGTCLYVHPTLVSLLYLRQFRKLCLNCMHILCQGQGLVVTVYHFGNILIMTAQIIRSVNTGWSCLDHLSQVDTWVSHFTCRRRPMPHIVWMNRVGYWRDHSKTAFQV